MKIQLLSPYHGGSHQAWAEGYGRFSSHKVEILKLPARFWKWRMHGAAVTLARRFLDGGYKPNLIMATDMLDISTFLSLTRSVTHHVPTVLYMHENQLTYPLPADKSTGPMRRQLGERDRHYAFINYASMLAADAVWFNSNYHRSSFFDELPNYLKHFPEFNELGTIAVLHKKSEVVPVGIDFQRLNRDENGSSGGVNEPLILWNQRWEYDKDPETFFAALDTLAEEGHAFRVALGGQQFGRKPPVFTQAVKRLGGRLVHAGYADSETYTRLLWEADITVSTAKHEFFGISILEAIHAHTLPILPARLSYPEIIPAQFHDACLYKDMEGLLMRLRRALTNSVKTKETAKALASATEIYDWHTVAPKYDERLLALVV